MYIYIAIICIHTALSRARLSNVSPSFLFSVPSFPSRRISLLLSLGTSLAPSEHVSYLGLALISLPPTPLPLSRPIPFYNWHCVPSSFRTSLLKNKKYA